MKAEKITFKRYMCVFVITIIAITYGVIYRNTTPGWYLISPITTFYICWLLTLKVIKE